jgi:hypothetical protein
MNLVDVLFNAAGGGIFGSLLHIGTSILDTWKKKKETETQIMLMKAQTEMAANASAWQAFANSQNQSAVPFQVPANTPPWISALYTCVQALKEGTRPGLCWALVFILTLVYFTSIPEVRAKITDEMTFGAFTAVFWYFGSRYTSKGRPTP